MGTRRSNRLVSANAARREFPSRRGFPGTGSGKPHARGPPLTEAAKRSSAARGRPPHRQGRKRREGDAGTSPSLNVGLAELVPVTASYVTW
jgi:hypothetical protein